MDTRFTSRKILAKIVNLPAADSEKTVMQIPEKSPTRLEKTQEPVRIDLWRVCGWRPQIDFTL
jgi:hypothetical protein